MPNTDKISRLTLTVKPGERYMIDGVPVEIGRRAGAGVVLMFTLRADQYVDRLGRKSTENDSQVQIVS